MKRYLWLALLVVGCNNNNDHEVTRADIVTDATDPTLINAWGLAFNPMGVAWVSANGTGVSEIYDVNGNHLLPPVTIPGPAVQTPDPPSTPTGQAFNGNANSFLGDAFIFVTEDGTISGWQSSDSADAMMRVDNSAGAAVYKGVAIGSATNGDARLYAANFHNASVDVFDGNYQPVSGGFVDLQLPAGFAPFNVAVVQGGVLVAYALQDADKEDDTAGVGNGFVDMYDGDGNLLGRLLSGGVLNSPWGMTLSPSSFGAAPNALIIGNFGDGLIHFYNFDSANHQATLDGTINDTSDNAIVIDGLWALQFGPGTGNFATDVLYFTAGPDQETHGEFGSLTSN
jgi:uncharacterized protein (TIGR03118 family)